ncbi:MAG: hypothetical protein ACK4FV_06505 [Candidatus Nitrosocaldus sp.]
MTVLIDRTVNSYKDLIAFLRSKLGSLYDEIYPVLNTYLERSNVRKKVNLDELDGDIDRLMELIVNPVVHKIVRENAPDFSWIPVVGNDLSRKVREELHRKTEEGIRQARYYLKKDKRLRENLQLFLQDVVDRYQ